MQDIDISKFKATCFAVLERVRRTRQPIRVTKFGDPVA
jgi:prevent-host-death family protein